MSSVLSILAKQMVRSYPISYQQALKIQKDRKGRKFSKVRDFKKEDVLKEVNK